MITTALILGLIVLVKGIILLLNGVGTLPFIGTLPYVSETSAEVMVDLVRSFHALLDTIPYFYATWYAFLSIVSFEIIALVAKFFLGSRVPIKDQTMTLR